MKNKANLFFFLSVVMCILAISILSGCQESEQVSEGEIPKGPVFYPAAPDLPRIQFLKSYSGPAEISVAGKKKASGFQAFIIGDEEQQEVTEINKPYGMALYDNKFYICDLGKSTVMILDLENGSYLPMTTDRRMVSPANLWIDNGNKYVSDSSSAAIYVFGTDDKLIAIWGKDLNIKPTDLVVKGEYLYVLDAMTSQVIVLDKTNGKEIKRLGVKGDEEGKLKYCTGLAVDPDGSVYVCDTVRAFVTKLDSEGKYQQTFGFRSLNIHGLSRPKGIDIDKKGRLWIVDAATNVVKIFDDQARLLLFFSEQGFLPGDLYMPASIRVDYDHIDYFRQFAQPEAEIECLLIVTSQYGPHKLSVYGLGKFPIEEAKRLKEREKDEISGVVTGGDADETDSEKDQSNDQTGEPSE